MFGSLWGTDPPLGGNVPTVPVILESGEVGLYDTAEQTMSHDAGPLAGVEARMLVKPDGSNEQLGWFYENDQGVWTEWE